MRYVQKIVIFAKPNDERGFMSAFRACSFVSEFGKWNEINHYFGHQPKVS